MKFTVIPTWDIVPPEFVGIDTGALFLALPMPGERVATLTPVDSTIYPVIMTMEQLFKWWHRVRQWEVSASHTVWGGEQFVSLVLDETDTTDEEITCDMPTGWNNAESADPLDWFRAGRWTGSFVWNDGAFDRTANFTLRILRKPSATIAESYYLTDDLTQILPYLRLECSGDGIDGNLWAADSAAFYDSSPTLQGSCTADIDGITPTMTAAFDTGSGFESDPMTLVLTPSLYWAHANPDGSEPAWNTLTGEQL